MYLQTKEKNRCSGCGACSKACPKAAIAMKADDHGFAYPVIDMRLCISCGLCEKVCPMDKPLADREGQEFYAVRSKDDAVVKQSSSGGLLTLMAEAIFAMGGTVYGAAYDEAFRAEHRQAENMAQAEAFRGSKYVQSDFSGVYTAVEADLKEGKPVLVTGTPCQIAGLQAYLRQRKADTENLYTCDNICHGVSSPMVFADYLDCLKKKLDADDKIISVNMRSKDGGEKTRMQVCSQKQGALAMVNDFSYQRLYQTRVAVRSSCFACPFTSYARPGDLSAGDFWNAKPSDVSFDIQKGINEVLVNSPKGQALLDMIRENAYIQSVTKEKAWQPHLEYATAKPERYDAFWHDYLSADDRERVMRGMMKQDMMSKVISTAMPILRKTGLYSLFGKLYRMVFVRKK